MLDFWQWSAFDNPTKWKLIARVFGTLHVLWPHGWIGHHSWTERASGQRTSRIRKVWPRLKPQICHGNYWRSWRFVLDWEMCHWRGRVCIESAEPEIDSIWFRHITDQPLWLDILTVEARITITQTTRSSRPLSLEKTTVFHHTFGVLLFRKRMERRR